MRQTLVVFDAAGTLITPVGGVIETYHATGMQFGSHLTIHQVGERFRQGRLEIFQNDPEFKSSEEIEFELWRELVEYVFSDVTDSRPLFEWLWNKFAQIDSWAKYDDVDDCLNGLKKNGIATVIGSNFDSRLLAIVRNLFDHELFDRVFCSSILGYRKPAPQFYQFIEQHYSEHVITMVGDDYENDVLGPKRIGWDAIQIDRSGKTVVGNSVANLRHLIQRITSV